MPLNRFVAALLFASTFVSCGARAADAGIDAALSAYEAGNYTTAANLLKPLADSGNAVAQHRLSVMHFYGRGVPENEQTALAMARKSAAAGNVDAMYFLGTMFVFGDEAPKLVDDPDREAAKWFFEAAKDSHPDAEYGLGLMFLAGKGVVQDQNEAIKWIRRAASHGHSGAQSFVASHDGKGK